MKIGITLVDLSGLPRWPHLFKASADIARAVDPWHGLRMLLGASLRPRDVQEFCPSPGMLLLVRLENSRPHETP